MNKIKILYHNHIIIDDFTTWPDVLKSLMQNKSSEILNYLHKKKEIDKLAVTNLNYRIYRPFNEFESNWNELLEEMKLILNKHKFIGFHCTRLLEKEIVNIKNIGLEPLTRDLIKRKIDLLKEAGLINSAEYEDLLSDNLSSSEYRKNRVFTIHSLWNLKNGLGLYPLWDCWGGEAIHFNKDDNSDFIHKFSQIGLATIVITSHSYKEVEKYEIEERLIKNFLYDIDDLWGSDFDNCHLKKVKVLDCITENQELFQKLTKYSSETEMINRKANFT